MYLIKYMDKMDNTSLAYREGNYRDLFRAARSSELDGADIVRYN